MTDARAEDISARVKRVLVLHSLNSEGYCEVCAGWDRDFGWEGEKGPCETVRILTGESGLSDDDVWTLTMRLTHALGTLHEIASEDYRGPRPTAAIKAEDSLYKIGGCACHAVK